MTDPTTISQRLGGTVSSQAERFPTQLSAADVGVHASVRPVAPWGSPHETWHPRPPAAWRVGDAIIALCLLAALLVAENLNHMPSGVGEFLAFRVSVKNVLLVTAFGLVWPRLLAACGLYAPNRLRTGEGEWARLACAGAVGCVLALVFPLTTTSGVVTPLYAFAFGAMVAPAAGLFRATARAVNTRHRSHKRQVVLVGSGPLAVRMYRQLKSNPLNNIVVLGFVDSEPHAAMANSGLTHLGKVEDLEEILMHSVVDDVFIGLPIKSSYEEIMRSIVACGRVGVRASYSGDVFGACTPTGQAGGLGAPVLSFSQSPSTELLAIKRCLDVIGALVVLIILSPVMVAIALAIRFTSPGPVFFSQLRYGYMKRCFRMYKFRTMVAGAERMHAKLEQRNEASGPVFKMRDDPRITPLGRFLRRTSLDELPQIIHVLTGHMSLVGPRPLATRDVGRFPEPWLMRRFSVRPGLTCLWQISGRSNLSFDEWIKLDLAYIDRWSLWLDMKILLRTIPAVIGGTGAM